jgi:SAM-dependent methyltransferase
MARPERRLERYNRAFYERCWRAGTVLPMPGVPSPAGRHAPVVELGCGLRPRLPLHAALFVDLSHTACAKLRLAGALAVCAGIDHLPFGTGTLHAIHAYEVLEHLEDDTTAVGEMRRALAPGGLLVVSTPLHPARWDRFDRVVGHARRYDPAALVRLMGRHGFRLEGFAPSGMRPRSRLLTRLGLYYLTRHPRVALRFSERFLRLTGASDGAVILRHGGSDAFLPASGEMDGAVTAWRLQPPAATRPGAHAV